MTTTRPAVRPAPTPSTVDKSTAETRRDTRALRSTDLLALVGAAAASVALTAVLFTQITPFSGPLGFVLVAYALFLVLYALLVSFDESGLYVRDRLVQAVVHSLAFLLFLALALVVV